MLNNVEKSTIERGFSVPEASALLGLSVRTVRSWVASGKINAVKVGGSRRWVILESEILRLRGGK